MMDRRDSVRKFSANVRIMDCILLVAFAAFIINSVVIGISYSHGEWVMGDVTCQLFALLSYFLVSSAAWLSSLAAFERYYKVASPGDHMSTFSEVNSKILIAGTYMLSFVLCTGPLYGWGEYSHFKGKVHLTSILSINNTENFGTQYSSKGNQAASFFCKPISATSQVTLMDVLKKMCFDFMKAELANMNIRTPTVNCTSGKVVFTLRATDFSAVEDIYSNHEEGLLSNKISIALSNGFQKFLNISTNFTVVTHMDTQEISEYQNIFLPFQSLGVCTLDFSPVNEFVISATSYVIITTILIPYGVTVFCAIGMYIRYHTGAVNSCFSDVTYLRIIYICGSFGLLLCLPYYIINYMNMQRVFVAREVNFVFTLLFYNSSLSIAVPYVLYRYPSLRFKRKANLNTQGETIMLNGICEETSISRLSLKYDSV